MTTRQDQISTGRSEADSSDAMGACRPVSPGILAVALLLALTTSVATAGVGDWSDPARTDRREAPRETTVRWLTEAVAKAVKELAEFEPGSDRTASSITNKAIVLTPDMLGVLLLCESLDTPPMPGSSRCVRGWLEMGLLNLPPPSVG